MAKSNQPKPDQAKQMITLRNKRGASQIVEMQHALNTLRRLADKAKGGWEIVGNEWEFKDNEIIRKSKNTDSKES